MADETIDAGLTELTEDILGPSADATTETQSQPSEQEPQATPEPVESQPADASAQAPTAPVEPQTVDINGRQYTREQLAAALQTREQFPHLQNKYLELKRAEDERRAREGQQQQPKLDPASVRASMRAAFDGKVKEAVTEGFMEADFAELYPDVAAGMVMYRDSLGAVANLLKGQAEKIAQYESEIVGERTVAEIKNNMAALAGQHQAFAPLSDPTVRDQFFGYLRYLDPKIDQLRDPEYMIGAWVAFKRNDLLNGVGVQQQAVAAQTAQRAANRRRAVADALPGSRPPSTPVGPATPLEEMVNDFFAPS